jgi:hypothetical protein
MNGIQLPDDKVVRLPEKTELSRVESVDDQSKELSYEKVDEFGAHTKTDPKEISLVKKLDFYILVSHLTCPWVSRPQLLLNPFSRPFGPCTF